MPQADSRNIADLLESLDRRRVRNHHELAHLLQRSDEPLRVQTVNAHHLYLAFNDREFRRAMDEADVIAPDGWPVVASLQLLTKNGAIERVTGADYVRALLARKFDPHGPIALIGASENDGDRFERLAQRAGISIAYRLHSRVQTWDSADVADELNGLGVRIAMVAVTPPAGEIFAARLKSDGYRGAIIAVGGAIEMAVGSRPRAPLVLQKIHLEWAFRLALEPRRLSRRYLVDCPRILGSLAVSILARRIRAAFSRRLARKGIK